MKTEPLPDAAENEVLDRTRRIRASQSRSAAEIKQLRLRFSALDEDFGGIRSRLRRLDARIISFDARLSLMEERSELWLADEESRNVAMREGAAVIQSRGHDV